ncbi:MAG: MFS transporter, partial [Alphaproteobacteria bacterium]
VFNPVGTRVFTAQCDTSRVALANAAIKYDFVAGPAGSPASVTVNGTAVPIDATFARSIATATQTAGYPTATDAQIIKLSGFFSVLTDGRALWIVGILLILVIYVTMVYGPIAAALVELFPTRIRYTAMSLPYHIGNGWFGGLLPATSFAMVAATGDIYYGLWYPIVIAMMTFVIGLLFVPETKDRDIFTYDTK